MPGTSGAAGDVSHEFQAEQLRALAHVVRLQILHAIRSSELSVGEIEELTGITQPGLSQQLSILRKAELVGTRRDGKQVFYSVDSERMVSLAAILTQLAGAPAATGAPSANPASPSTSLKPESLSGAATFARVFR